MPIKITGDTYLKFVKVGTMTVLPVANFTRTPSSGNAPLTVNFTDTSTNYPTSWLWHFGDGATSTLQNPSHTYSSAASFTPSLTATNSSGSASHNGSAISVSPAAFSGSANINSSGILTGSYYSVVSFGSGSFTMTDYTSTHSYYTTNSGSTWTLANTGSTNGVSGLAYGSGYVAGVTGNSTTVNQLWYTTDGITWGYNSLPVTGQWRGVVFGGGQFVVYGSNTNVLVSSDLSSWSTVSSGVTTTFVNGNYDNGIFMLCGTNNLVGVSADGGASWSHHSTPVAFLSVAYGNGVWVGTAQNGNSYTSTDNGTTWTTHTSVMPISSFWYQVRYGNGVFLAVCDSQNSTGSAAYSTNGTSWSTVSGMQGSGWRGLAYSVNGTFAVTHGGTSAATIV